MTTQRAEELECSQAYDPRSDCEGLVEYHMPLSGTGTPFPRCERHWKARLDLEDGLRHRYPVSAPADWDPLDAGEAWGEDDY